MSVDNTKLVYSTGRVIPKQKSTVVAEQSSVQPLAQQKVIVRLDRKGRGGKSVTVIEGLKLRRVELESLLKGLKTLLGTGGTAKDSVLEIQGDHCAALMSKLHEMGYRPKRSGS